MTANTLQQNSASLSRDDYTIGWISALAIESAAAAEMLDTEYDLLPVAEGDSNDYVLGTIGQHNVVMACLNEAGGLPAHIVATNLMKSFHNVRYILMVGIGGGIPSEQYQIRLGDIVVSEPKDRSPGVVQSDFGKWEVDGFKITGSLNRPAEGLIRVMGAMKRQQLRNRSKIHAFVKHYPGASTNPDWRYQGRENDPVYLKDLEPRQDGVCSECNSLETEQAQCIPHAPDPKVHYGIIASGNQVIKNQTQRDKLHDDLGACCVEMEAFGLLNSFPCLVIRGISDYADGGKNNKWQPYSSLAAAAYAKELLLHLSSVDVGYTLKMSEQLKKLTTKLNVIEEKLDATRHEQEDQNSIKILDWISLLKPRAKHDAVFDQRTPQTSTLLLDEFLKWKSDLPASSMLCALGDPGAGKTVAMSVLVDKLSKDCSDSLKIGVACVYLDLGNQSKQTTTGIIGVITKQLLGQLPRIPKRIGDIWRQHRLNNASIEQIKEMLCEACEAFTETYICIDALDECKDRSTLLDYFTKAHSTVNSIRLICTGRPHIHQSIINIALLNPHMVTIKACESDLRKFIKWRIEKDNKPAYMNQELKEEIIQTLLGISDGIFLLPWLHIKLVLSKNKIKPRRKELQSLKSSVKETFDRTMERIRDSGEIVDATNVLTWIYLSGRPLTVNELLHALAVEQGEEDIDEENVDNREIFLDCCLGLATIDTENSTVRLFHSRLHEYFEERGQVFEQTFKQGHDYIARTCLTYIMFRPLTLNLLPQKGTDSPASDAKTISDYHLLDYASCQWGRHLEKSGQAENMVVELAKRYLSMDPRKRYWSQWYLCSHIIQGSRFESFVASFSKLHIAAYFGIDSVLSDTLLAAAELNSRDAAFGQTPLSWAAKGGHLAVVKLLVKAAGVEVDSNDWYNQTPLSWAAGNGHESVVELLLETANVEVDSKSIYHRTPLSWAAENAHVKIVELLLKTGKVDVNYESSWGGTPLSWATRAKREGYEAVVELLLKTENVDVGYRDEHSQTTQRQSTSTTEIVSDSYSFTLTDDSAREHGFNATGWETLRTNDRWEVMAKGSRLTINGSGAAGAILYTHANGERFVVVLGIHNYDIWSAIESKFDNDTLEEVITSYYPSARPKVTRTDSGSDRVTKSLSDGKVAKLQIKDDNGSRRNYLVWISVTQ